MVFRKTAAATICIITIGIHLHLSPNLSLNDSFRFSFRQVFVRIFFEPRQRGMPPRGLTRGGFKRQQYHLASAPSCK